MEVLELVELLADRDQLDRAAGDRLDRQRCAPAGVAVELRHQHAVEGDALLERLGDVHRLLPRHRVEHEQDVGRLRRRADGGEFVHQRLVDMETPCGVEDDHVARIRTGVLNAS